MAKIKVKLLTDGGFKGLEDLDYSTIFDAEEVTNRSGELFGVAIDITDLIAAGAVTTLAALNLQDSAHGTLYFGGEESSFGEEYEVVD